MACFHSSYKLPCLINITNSPHVGRRESEVVRQATSDFFSGLQWLVRQILESQHRAVQNQGNLYTEKEGVARPRCSVRRVCYDRTQERMAQDPCRSVHLPRLRFFCCKMNTLHFLISKAPSNIKCYYSVQSFDTKYNILVSVSICLCLVGYCQSYVYTSSPHRPQRMRQGVGKLSSVMATESSFPFLTLFLSEKLLGFWGIRPITLLVLFLDQGPRLILSHQKYCCEAVVPPDRLPLFGIW